MNEHAPLHDGSIHIDKRIWITALFMAVGIAITLVLFWKIRGDELLRFNDEFEKDAAVRSHLIQSKMESCLLVTESSKQLFYSSDLVEPHEFRTFTSPILAQVPEISAIGWVRCVPRPEANLGSARQQYSYPFIYVEPAQGMFRDISGFDMGSSPDLLRAIEKAQATGKMVALMDTRLKKDTRCTVVLNPVYFTESETGPVNPRKGAAKGVIVAILAHDGLKYSFREITGSESLNLSLVHVPDVHETKNGKQTIAFSSSGAVSKKSWASWFVPSVPAFLWEFPFADHTLDIELTAGQGHLKKAYPFAFWFVLPVGLLLSLLLSMYIHSVLSHRQRLVHLVKERTADLRKSEEKYRLLVENASEGVFVAQDGVFMFANARAAELLGIPRQELLSSDFSHYIHPQDRDMVMDRYQRRMKGDDVPSIYVIRMVSRQQQTIWLQVNSIRITWEGRPAALVFLTDISERICAEEEKLILERQLAQAQKMESIGTLAGGIAHDFNNILSSVLGYSGLAKLKLEKKEPVGDEIDQIMKAGIRARDLVKQILTFSRRTEIRKEPVMISPLIKECIKLLRASIPTTVEVRQELNSSACVMADPTQIHQIIMNLCTNAAHAMMEGGGILCVALKEVDITKNILPQYPGIEKGTYLRLTVSDTGKGIPGKIIDRIFDPFFTTKERGEGTGMGLSVVHGIVKEMAGMIRVFSEPGTGTTFHILLPIHSGGAASRGTDPALPLKGKGKILFVDDEDGILESARGILQELGYTVLTSDSPAGALELFGSAPDTFDLVVTDQSMPRMTGDELSEKIHEIRPGIPVILCTGFDYGIMKDRIETAGITGLVMKPMMPSELAAAVYQALGSISAGT